MPLSNQGEKKKLDLRVLRFEKQEEPKLRLFAFPHAGAGAVAYHSWGNQLPDSIELIALQYPGRGYRNKDPLCSQIQALVEDCLRTIKDYNDVPFVFFGHSMGGLIAFETARALRHSNKPLPSALFLSAVGLRSEKPVKQAHKLPDTELIEYINDLGGMPPDLLNSKELLAFLLPVIRSDLQAFETWDYQPDAPLPIDIVAFGGNNDSSVSLTDLQAWERETTASFRLRMLSAGHFYIAEQSQFLLTQIKSSLGELGALS